MMVRFPFVGLVLALVVQTRAIRLVEQQSDSPGMEPSDQLFRRAAQAYSRGEELPGLDPKWTQDNFLTIPQQYWGIAEQWLSRFVTDVIDGSAARYDELMGRCCEIANTTGLRPHDGFGTASKEQISWWNKTGCNKMVGASVLAVGTPLCDTWKFLKTAFVSDRIPHLELTQKKDGGCTAEDRHQIYVSMKYGTPGTWKTNPICQTSRFFSEGKVSVSRLTYCVYEAFGHISNNCSFCYIKPLIKMLDAKDMATHVPCYDMCTGMDKCWGQERCIRMAGNCTRCFERHFLKHKFCTGGPVYQALDGPTVLRKMMGFWTHLR